MHIGGEFVAPRGIHRAVKPLTLTQNWRRGFAADAGARHSVAAGTRLQT